MKNGYIRLERFLLGLQALKTIALFFYFVNGVTVAYLAHSKILKSGTKSD